MGERTWRIGIVGLGAAGRTIHLPAIRKVEGLEAVGGVDPSPSFTPGFPVFPSLGAMVAGVAPDIIAIVTPPASHHRLILESLEAGCHVFCEKPLTVTLEEAGEVVAAAERAGRRVVVNNEFRFMNVHEAARARIGSDEMGRLLFVSISQTFRTNETTEAGWRGEGDRRTCFEFGTHALDLCRFFFDAEPMSVAARMPRPFERGGADYLNLLQLEFPGDRVAHITLDRLSRGPHRYLDTRLDGERAAIEISLGGRAEMAMGIRGGDRRPYMRLDLAPSAQARLCVGERCRVLARDPIDLFPNATAKLLKAFLDALDAGTAPPCEARENVGTLEMMLRAYESSDRGGAAVPLTSGGAARQLEASLQ